jgi:DNA-binding transcriptional LysR family regulator
MFVAVRAPVPYSLLMLPEPLPHLDTFLLAAELNSFTGAARTLKITQAAVSQRVQTLEQVLGVPLFLRQGGRVALTEAGRQLYPFAQQILDLHQKARQKVTGMTLPLVGELSLAASSIPGDHLLPALLSAFRKKHPHIQVRATVSNSHEVLGQLEHGQASLGLVGAKVDSAHIRSRPFAEDSLALIVPGQHPWSKRRSVTVAELGTQPLILREAGSGSRASFEQALASAGKSLREMQVALELGSNEAIKKAVQGGLGAAILSTRGVQKELKSGKLRALDVKGLPLKREMLVVWDERRALSIPAQLFLDLLQPGKHLP